MLAEGASANFFFWGVMGVGKRLRRNALFLDGEKEFWYTI